MEKKKEILKTIILLTLIILGYYNQDTIEKNISKTINLQDLLKEKENYTYEIKKINYNLNENINTDIQLEFCPSKRCLILLNESLASAKTEIKCAFYELDQKDLIKTILKKSKEKNINISLIIDDKYLNEENFKILYNTSINIFSDVKRHTRYNNYMHNKFCIIDNKILLTGSMNPTQNGIFKNNNNLLKIESEFLSKNYENEFDQMNGGIFGENKKTTLEYNNITLNYNNDKYLISSYLCPEDNCAEEVSNILKSAKKNIYFASFAFTLDKFSNTLKNKSKEIEIKGIIEKRNLNLKGSDIKKLNETFPIYLDKNKYNMHHKFFIIDEETIITGSMNPSGSGTKYNDENILIIKNKNLAKKYLLEFNKLIS